MTVSVTVGENIIAITKIRNTYGAIHSNIDLFSIAPWIVVALKGVSEKITVIFKCLNERQL